LNINIFLPQGEETGADKRYGKQNTAQKPGDKEDKVSVG